MYNVNLGSSNFCMEKETYLVVRNRACLRGVLLAPSCRLEERTPQAHHPWLRPSLSQEEGEQLCHSPPLPHASVALTPIQGSGHLEAPYAAAGVCQSDSTWEL